MITNIRPLKRTSKLQSKLSLATTQIVKVYWSFTRSEPLWGLFREEVWTHLLVMIRVAPCIVIKSPLCALCCIVHTANMEIRSFINWSLTRGLKQLKQRKIIKPALQKIIVVVYQRWSFMRGSNYRVLTGNIFVLWKGGRLQER